MAELSRRWGSIILATIGAGPRRGADRPLRTPGSPSMRTRISFCPTANIREGSSKYKGLSLNLS